jgi:hypothetical protein
VVDKQKNQEITLDAATLERFVGFYLFNDDQVLTVTRDNSHLVTRLTGQLSLPIYPRGNTEFFGKLINVEYSFIIGTEGQATSLVLRQSGRDFSMHRIDATTAQESKAD